jgi:hypothetical protein
VADGHAIGRDGIFLSGHIGNEKSETGEKQS